jgi:hypothetical protein
LVTNSSCCPPLTSNPSWQDSFVQGSALVSTTRRLFSARIRDDRQDDQLLVYGCSASQHKTTDEGAVEVPKRCRPPPRPRACPCPDPSRHSPSLAVPSAVPQEKEEVCPAQGQDQTEGQPFGGAWGPCAHMCNASCMRDVRLRPVIVRVGVMSALFLADAPRPLTARDVGSGSRGTPSHGHGGGERGNTARGGCLSAPLRCDRTSAAPLQSFVAGPGWLVDDHYCAIVKTGGMHQGYSLAIA